MSMSKKDFIALADAIKYHNSMASFPESTMPKFTQGHLDTLADLCQYGNPNFKRERWLDYIAGKVGPNGGAL